MGIYRGTLSILFLKSISTIVGNFFIMFIKDNVIGGRPATAETYYSPEISFVSKVITHAQVILTVAICFQTYTAHPEIIELRFNYWYESLISPSLVLCGSILFCILILGTGLIKLDNQGIDIDTDTEKEKILEREI